MMRFSKLDIKDKRVQILVLALLVLIFSIFFFSFVKEIDCSKGEDLERIRCWEEKVKSNVLRKGLDKTFDQLEDFYGGDPVFARNCHGMMHIFGETAYELYKDDPNSVVYNKSMTECGYGFLHGFVDKLIVQEEDGLQKAGQFCEELGNSQSDLPAETVINDCFHGIGHGVIDDQTGYGSLEFMNQIVKEAIGLCDDITTSDQYSGFCKDGAFHSASTILIDNVDLPGFDEQDPLAFCREYDQPHMAICHGSFASLVMAINENNLVDALEYLDGIQDRESAVNFLRVVTAYRAFESIDHIDFPLWIEECRSVGSDWFDACIDGLAIGLMDFSGPGEQARNAFSLCQSEKLSPTEQFNCGKSVINRAQAYLGQQAQDELCSVVGDKYASVCGKGGI